MSDLLCLALETSSRRGSIALGRNAAAGAQPHAAAAAQPPGTSGAAPTLLAHRALNEARRPHAAELLPAIQQMLAAAGIKPADIQVVAFSQGPGSFTGLRIAATVARMWQAATGCQVVGVPTLEAIARNALAPGSGREAGVVPPAPSASPTRIAVLVDARRNLVFGAVFEHAAHENEAAQHAENRRAADELRHVVPAGLFPADSFIADLPRPCALLGDAMPKYEALLAGLSLPAPPAPGVPPTPGVPTSAAPATAAPATTVPATGLAILPEATWFPDAREVLAIGLRRAAAGQFCRPEEILPLYLRPPECEEVYEAKRAAAKARRA